MLRSASVKDVAAAAGVSLGTVSNVLNRPDRVSPATRARVEQAMADLGFVRNESARQLRAGKSRPAGLRHARRDQPVLHRRRRGHRGRGRGGGPLPLHVQQPQQRRPREGLPRPPRRAARAGHPDHAGRPGVAHARRGRPARHPAGRRRPDPCRRRRLLGLRGRRARRSARGRAPRRPRPPAGGVRRRTDVDRPGARPLGRRRPRLGGCRPAGGRPAPGGHGRH